LSEPGRKLNFTIASLPFNFPLTHQPGTCIPPIKLSANAIPRKVQPEKQVHHFAPATFFTSFSGRAARARLPEFACRYAKLPVRFGTSQFACLSRQ
jgi:hypothetical protein